MKVRRRSWRRRLIWLATAVVVLLAGLYAYVTQPARLRAHVLRALGPLVPGQVDVVAVTFSPWGGFELLNVDIVPATRAPTPDENEPPRARSGLHVEHARIRCDWPALLIGKWRPSEIIVSGAELRLVYDSGAERRESDLNLDMSSQTWSVPAEIASAPPRFELDRLDVELIGGGRNPQLLRRWLVSAVGTPTETGYTARLQTPGNPASLLAELKWDRPTGELSATGDWMNAETAARFVPAGLAELREELALHGRIRIEQAVLAPAPLSSSETGDVSSPLPPYLRTATLRFAESRFSLPVEAPPAGEPALPAARRFLQFGDADVTLRMERETPADPATLELRGTAQLNGAPAEFSLAAHVPTAGARLFRPEDVFAAELRVRGLGFPTAEQHPTFVQSPRLSSAVRSFFSDYRPDGPFNIWMRAQRVPAAGSAAEPAERLAVDGELEALGLHCLYFRFPYEFDDARGRVRFSDAGIRIEGVTARHGSCRVRADGLVNHSSSNTGFDLVLRGTTISLDADLLAALPPEYQQLWQRVAPLGTCDAQVHVQREDGTPSEARPTDVHVDARLLAGSLLLESNRRLCAAEGPLTIARGVVTVHDLTGFLDRTAVRLSGTLGVDPHGAPTDLAIRAVDAPIELSNTGGNAATAGEIRFSGAGRADVWGRLQGSDGSRETQYVVHVKDGWASGTDPLQRWNPCAGWIRAIGDGREIVSLRARQADAILQVAGTLPVAAAAAEPVSLDLRIDDAVMERVTPQVTPPRWARVVTALGLAGRGAVELRLRPDESPGAPARQAADVTLSAERMTPAALPLELRAATIRARVTGDMVDVQQAAAAFGAEGRISASGQLESRADVQRGDFRLSAEKIDLSPQLVEALPAPVARWLRRLAPQGRVNLGLDRLEVDERRRWELAGRLAFEHTQLDLGLLLTELSGQLVGHCTILGSDGVNLAATLHIDEGRIAGRAMQNWDGRLAQDSNGRWLELSDLRGRLCDGDALGSVRIDPESGAYEVSVTLRNVAFAELLPPRPGQDATSRDGRADGHISVRGVSRDAATRNGGGDLRIRSASFLQTPIMAQVAEASRAADRPVGDDLDQIELRFLWRGDMLELTRVEMQTRDLRLLGEGTWDMKTDVLEVTLLGAPPERWPRVAVLSDLLEAAQRELLQYRVSGTAASPKVTTEPLGRLSETLRRLLEKSALLKGRN